MVHSRVLEEMEEERGEVVDTRREKRVGGACSQFGEVVRPRFEAARDSRSPLRGGERATFGLVQNELLLPEVHGTYLCLNVR